jgi:hypothetical protein
MSIVKKIGCFLRSCGGIAEFVSGKELEVNQINDLWNYAKSKGYINNRNEIVKSAPIANRALKILHAKGYFVEIGTKRNGIIKYYESITDDLKERPKYFIQKIRVKSEYGTHFRIVNCNEKVIFDPFTPDLQEEGIYYTIVYAYVGDGK